MKITTFLLLYILSTPCAFSQLKTYNLVCIYVHEYQPDSTDGASRKKEEMYLLSNGNSSIFKSKNLHLMDSANISPVENANILNYFMSVRTDFKYTIYKDSLNEIFFTDNIDLDKFRYKETKSNLRWQITSDTMTINGFICQKALLEYAGRSWIAWFSQEIPINDGPYKFCGLPGLITKIADTRNHYSFLLKEIYRRSGKIFTSKKEAKEIDKEGYYLALSYFRQNQLELQKLRGLNIISGEEEIKKRIKDNLKKNNNPLELETKNKY